MFGTEMNVMSFKKTNIHYLRNDIDTHKSKIFERIEIFSREKNSAKYFTKITD